MTRSGIYIVAYGALLHIGWAIALLTTADLQMATPIAPYAILGSSRMIACVLIGVSVLALAGQCFRRETLLSLLTIVPQQVLLMASAWASGVAVLDSAYADGVVRDRVFIFCDQLPNILAMLLHTWYVMALTVQVCTAYMKEKPK